MPPVPFQNAFTSVNDTVIDTVRLALKDAAHASDFDWGFDLHLPYQLLGIFARHIDTAAPITRLPLFALANFAVIGAKVNAAAAGVTPEFPVLPLGVVGSDHVGYASFDLGPTRQSHILQSIHDSLGKAGLLGAGKPRLTVGLSHLLVMPFKDPKLRFDALKEGDLAPNFICLRINIDAAMLAERYDWHAMPSMQTPGIIDWRLSPGSFSMSGALVIGDDGCETLLPTNLATRLVRFRQLIRTQAKSSVELIDHRLKVVEERDKKLELEGRAVLGYVVQFNSEWFPLGHSLGQIAYSLPLAPGEKMAISIIDWTRQDVAKRTENTTEKEDLQHAALRDRTLSETVHMVVQESQSGSSFMAGMGSSAGAGAAVGPFSLGMGLSYGLGGASSDSRGMRDVVGNTTQAISDAFHQASSALRELSSTVVVQSTQTEAAQARTRIIVNHNHSHAMTILYYEVLQHHRVLTRPASIRPCIFFRYRNPDFDYDNILQYRSPITSALLDTDLKSCIDIVVKRACLALNLEREKKRREEQGDPLDDLTLGKMVVTYDTGEVPVSPVSNVIFSIIPAAGGVPIQCDLVDISLTQHASPPWPSYPAILYNFRLDGTYPLHANSQFVYEVRTPGIINWKNVQAIQIEQTIAPVNKETNPDLRPWDLNHVRVVTQSGTNKWVMVDGAPPAKVPHNGRVQMPVNKFTPPVQSVDDLLSNDELCCLDRLIKHLNAHRAYYWRAIWMAENATDRAVRLDQWQLDGNPLSDLVENTLLDFNGDYAIMPVASGAERALAAPFQIEDLGKIPVYNESIEQILTTPERGVFAEAKLGQCNASEIIDNNRFWDWQLSPIPDEVPAIAPASTDSRYQDPTKGLTPTAFPPNIVNIVNPQSLPEPTGLAAAAGLLSALGPFRDMSGMQQLAQFLQTLSNNATQLALQGLKNAAGGGSGGLAGGGTGGSSAAPSGTTPGNAPVTGGTTPGSGTSTNGTSTPPGGAAPQVTLPSVPAPAPVPATTSKPLPPPQPQRSPALSKQTHLLVFTFSFDTNDVMMGYWTVQLISGADIRKETRVTNTVDGVSGRAGGIGNRMEVYVEEEFGGTNNVTVQINGTIVGLPQALRAGTRNYEVKTWSEPRDFTADITRADFNKARTIRVVQATEPISYTVSRTVQGTTATTTITNVSAGLEVGVENAVEAGVDVKIGEAKDTVKVNAKGTFNVSAGDQKLTQLADGYTETVVFNGHKITSAAPSIKPLL
jgi:hypothetical protein